MVACDERSDMDSKESIEFFVDRFYERVLADERLSPIFVDVAEVELSVHLPHIKNYWCKLLLGEKKYQRHTMSIHRQLNDKRALQSDDFQRWLTYFCATADEHFAGKRTERAKYVAKKIAANMEKSFQR